MNAHTSTIPDPAPEPVDDTSSPLEVTPRRVLVWVAVVLGGLAAWFWWTGAEERAIRRLPPTERAALYERELATFKSVCLNDPEPALDQPCRHRATVLSWLPECDAECVSLISKVIPVGSPPPNPRGLGAP